MAQKTRPKEIKTAEVPADRGSRSREIRDWVQALGAISIPIVAVLLTGYFAWTQSDREQTSEDRRKETEEAVEAERAANQQQAEESRATNEALQNYLDDMTDLMLKELAPDNPLQIGYIKELKRARTLTILARLNRDQENKEEGKRTVLQFVYESGWIDVRASGETFFDMSGADLSSANLSGLDLSYADLRGIILDNADLSGADLTGARMTNEQLIAAQTFEGATMPDGSVHD